MLCVRRILVFGLCRSGKGVFLTNLVFCKSLIDRTRGLALFSTPTWIALEGKSCTHELCSIKGNDSLCWVCVDVLGVKLALV